MSYNTELQGNNAELEELLEMANNLPDAVAGSFIVTATAGDGEVTGVSATFAAMYAAYQSGKHLILIISSPYTDSASLLQCDYVSPENIIFSALSTVTGEDIVYSVNILSDDTNTYLSNEVGGGVDEETLNAAVESALTEAKESGEFDGPPGDDGVSPTITVITITGGHRITITDKNGTKNVDIMDGADGRGIKSIARTSGSGAAGTTDTYTITFTDNTTSTFTVYNGKNGTNGTSVTVSKVTESTASGGTNVVTFSDGTTLNVKNGKDGEDYVLTDADKNEIADSIATGLTLGVHTDGLIYIFKDGEPIGSGIEMGVSGDVVGYVDSANNIILNGNLADGTYSVKYEMDGGKTVNIGNLVLDTNVYYTVKNTLTNCKNSNSATQVKEGDSYSATITANDGYELKTVTVTMGGANVSVSGGKINIASVTGNIVITAVAEEKQAAEPTNFAEPNTSNTTDWSIWCNNARFGGDGTYRALTGNIVTNYVPFQVGDTLYFEGLTVATTGTSMNQGLVFYDSSKANICASYLEWYETYSGGVMGNFDVTNGTYTFTLTNAFKSYQASGKPAGSKTAYVRISGALTGSVDDVVIRVKRNGEWL